MCSSEVAFGDDPNYKTHPQIYRICNTLAKMEGKKLYEGLVGNKDGSPV
jgi:hypothetical protein